MLLVLSLKMKRVYLQSNIDQQMAKRFSGGKAQHKSFGEIISLTTSLGLLKIQL